MTLRALIFDVDGTLAETEEVHRQAFNETFAAFGLDWHWSAPLYRDLLQVTGGKERIRFHRERDRPDEPDLPPERIAALHAAKTERYTALVEDGAAALRPGVARLVAEAQAAGLRLAIATTTSRPNVTALLRRTLPPHGEAAFAVIAAGDEVARKKPWPDVYLRALEDLGLRAGECLALEDSANGVRAARGAGIPVLATPSLYTEADPFDGALSVVSDLGEPGRPHRHRAGRAWRGGFVTCDGLRALAAGPEAVAREKNPSTGAKDRRAGGPSP